MKELTGVGGVWIRRHSGTRPHDTALSISISGSGTITENGTVDDQDLEISGSGEYEAAQLTSKAVKAAISGSGTANVLATDAWMSRSAAAER